MVQHNAYCQEKFIDHPTYINLLIDMVEKDKNLNVRIKALHAISCKLTTCYVFKLSFALMIKLNH